MSNYLKDESSPYLLQHAENPVDWYPWCDEAFDRAKKEKKPVFLSIGYSTCHWCHVMAHESFENQETADILNKYFICIKVDREERPDIDSVYMSVCQAFTGGGGWPMSIFMTPDQKPFFAGTYFPPENRHGIISFPQLLLRVAERWETDRDSLFTTANQVCAALSTPKNVANEKEDRNLHLISKAIQELTERFDNKYGGFGEAPKFPAPHNLLFLMLFWKMSKDKEIEQNSDGKDIENKEGKQRFILMMAEKTLDVMRRGGIFDQIGYGFSRYSTDSYFLVPHFEKMLYDNAMLILAYSFAYCLDGRREFLDTAEKTAQYLFREMADENGAFYSAQDADSEGTEGKFYLWDFQEVCSILGEERGREFCSYYGISQTGNFEGKNIPNLLQGNDITDDFAQEIQVLYQYRKNRAALHRDDKILTAWNAMAICAMAILYRAGGEKQYLLAAEKTAGFIEEYLTDGNILYVGFRNEKRFVRGFLDEYAYYTAALITLYGVTLNQKYLNRALEICEEAHCQFSDKDGSGYFLYGDKNSSLIARPKESYDGAMPSGNSVMAYCLVRLARITGEEKYTKRAKRQLAWMSGEAEQFPSGYCFFLTALLLEDCPEQKITVIIGKEEKQEILRKLPMFAKICFLREETPEYKMLNGKTTYYVCKNHTCLPPSNEF